MKRIVVILCCVAALVVGNMVLYGCQQEAPESVEAGMTKESKPSDTQREQMRKSRMPPADVKK